MGAIVGAVDTIRDLGPRVFMPPIIALGVTSLTSIALIIADWRSGLLLFGLSAVAFVLAPVITRWAHQAAAQRRTFAATG